MLVTLKYVEIKFFSQWLYNEHHNGEMIPISFPFFTPGDENASL